MLRRQQIPGKRSTDLAVLERHLAVNLFGIYAVTQAFLPAATRSRGAIVNILSAPTG